MAIDINTLRSPQGQQLLESSPKYINNVLFDAASTGMYSDLINSFNQTPAGSFSYMINCHCDTTGVVTTRKPLQAKVLTKGFFTGYPCQTVPTTNPAQNQINYFVMHQNFPYCNILVMNVDEATGGVSVVNSNYLSQVSYNNKYRLAVWNSCAYMTVYINSNSRGIQRVNTASVVEPIVSLPAGMIVDGLYIGFDGRYWLWGNTNRLYFSNVMASIDDLAASLFSINQYIDLPFNQGEQIMGIETLSGTMFVFTTHNVYRIYSYQQLDIVPAFTVGVYNGFCIDKNSEGIWFFGNDGLFLIPRGDTTQLKEVSRKILPLINNPSVRASDNLFSGFGAPLFSLVSSRTHVYVKMPTVTMGLNIPINATDALQSDYITPYNVTTAYTPILYYNIEKDTFSFNMIKNLMGEYSDEQKNILISANACSHLFRVRGYNNRSRVGFNFFKEKIISSAHYNADIFAYFQDEYMSDSYPTLANTTTSYTNIQNAWADLVIPPITEPFNNIVLTNVELGSNIEVYAFSQWTDMGMPEQLKKINGMSVRSFGGNNIDLLVQLDEEANEFQKVLTVDDVNRSGFLRSKLVSNNADFTTNEFNRIRYIYKGIAAFGSQQIFAPTIKRLDIVGYISG